MGAEFAKAWNGYSVDRCERNGNISTVIRHKGCKSTPSRFERVSPPHQPACHTCCIARFRINRSNTPPPPPAKRSRRAIESIRPYTRAQHAPSPQIQTRAPSSPTHSNHRCNGINRTPPVSFSSQIARHGTRPTSLPSTNRSDRPENSIPASRTA